jgi:hypothetical protein
LARAAETESCDKAVDTHLIPSPESVFA